MTTTSMPPIAPAPRWSEAVAEINRQEKALIEQARAIAAARRRLPMTPVQRSYTFVGAEGELPFADVFHGARQLVMYHFMFAPDWEQGCPHCTQYARNQGAGINDELGPRDTRYVLVSRASYPKLRAWQEHTGIATPWYSVSTAFSEEMGAITDDFGDIPGISVFFRADDNSVYRTYSTHGDAVELTMPANAMLRMTAWGMQEQGEDSPPDWPQRFDAMG